MADLGEEDLGAAAAAAPAAAAPQEEEPPATIEEYIREEAPYPEERAAKLKLFYKKRNKNPGQYTYLEDGNLCILGKDGDVVETIPLKTYVPYDAETWATRDQRRLDVIGMAETAYEDAMTALRAAMETYTISGRIQPVLAAQAAVASADAILSRVRYGARSVVQEKNPETREVLFEQKAETRRLFRGQEKALGSDLTRMTVREYPYYSFYGTYVESAAVEAGIDAEAGLDERPDESEAAVRQRLKDGRMARIFFDADDGPNGFLSPFWPVEFTMGETRYFTAYQAYEVERAKEGGNEALRTKLLGTRSGRTIRFLARSFTAQPKDPKALWLNIYLAIFQQHPELKERLLATGTDALVFADEAGGSAGIGLAPSSSRVVNPSRWKGENIVGLTLETLRIQFREGTAKEAPEEAAAEGVITEEEQAAARTGAIIGQRKKFQFKRPGGPA